jgi:CheY-like chemotaxis protein
MSDGVRLRAFEPFFTTKPVGEGTGLGLSMVYGLARQQGGMVQAESEPGVGTSVHIFFPAHSEPSRPVQSPSVVSAATKGEETILLVEDEEMLRDVGRAVLEQHGYKVLVAGDGQEALELFLAREAPIDLIISDVVMPRLGGVELYHAIREAGGGVRFLLASGYPGRQVPSGSDLDQHVPFIKKPWRMGELLEKVREVLSQPME